MGDLVPREKVSQQGVRAVGGIGGGVALYVAAELVGWLLGWIPIVGGLGGNLLKLASFGLLAFGGYNGFQFIRNLRRRR